MSAYIGKKPTITPATAAHNDLFVGNVRFANRKATLVSLIANGRCGSIPAFELMGFRPQQTSGIGYRRTKSSLPQNVGFDPECGNWSAENWVDLLKPTCDDCFPKRLLERLGSLHSSVGSLQL